MWKDDLGSAPMARAASFVPSSESDVLADGGSSDDHAMDRIMADLALAFDLDIDLANAEDEEPKWPMGHTLAFVIVTSAALWALIAGFIFLV